MNARQLLDAYEREWDKVRPFMPAAQVAAVHIISAPLLMADYNRIYTKGQAGFIAHEGGIVRMGRDELLVNAREEMDDEIWYLAKLLSRGWTPYS